MAENENAPDEPFEKVEVESEVNISHDKLIGKAEQWAKEEAERASSAGETRQDIGAFLEETGVHSKALAHIRSGLKLKKESARLDWLRSMELMLPMAADHIRGQSTAELPMEEKSAA